MIQIENKIVHNFKETLINFDCYSIATGKVNKSKSDKILWSLSDIKWNIKD